VYTPGTPPPGTSCTDAANLSLDTLYTYSATGGVTYWVKWPVVAGTVYYFSQPDIPSTATRLLLNGGACPFPFIQSATEVATNCYQFTAGTTGPFWVQYSSFTGPVTFKFFLSAAGCYVP
jgi:hypothetical protein